MATLRTINTREAFAKALGKRIRRARKDRGMTAYRVSKLTGISIQQLSGYELGQQCPSTYFVGLIAAALECSPDELVPRVKRKGGR